MNSTNLQNHPTFHQKERLVNLHSTQKRALCWSIFSHMNIKILLRFIVIATGLNAVYSVPKKVLGIRFRTGFVFRSFVNPDPYTTMHYGYGSTHVNIG